MLPHLAIEEFHHELARPAAQRLNVRHRADEPVVRQDVDRELEARFPAHQHLLDAPFPGLDDANAFRPMPPKARSISPVKLPVLPAWSSRM